MSSERPEVESLSICPTSKSGVHVASRIRGSLYGVAIGDALGGPVEFRARGSFKSVTGYRYNHNFNLKPGTWTDDTSMTLCLAQSLVENEGKFLIPDQIKKYMNWMEHGYMSATGVCFDIGNATRHALTVWKESMRSTTDANAMEIEHIQRIIDRTLNREVIVSVVDNKLQVFCGNGSLMRCTPVPLVYHGSHDLAQQYAAKASSLTHPHPTCQQACQIYTHLLVEIIENSSLESKTDLWECLQRFDATEGGGFGTAGNLTPALRDALGRYRGLEDLRQTPDHEIKSSGYVVHTLEAAQWAFFTTETFQEGALKVVNLGNDADTVGAVYGGLAGAWYGQDALPVEWLDGLQAKPMIDQVVEGVTKLVANGAYDGGP
ncbi:hypothetical protein ACLMJK_001201 [Lecanora helva]